MEYFFVHINKTGGSSIEAALGIHLQHVTAQQIVDAVGLPRWQRAFTFGFVRNPWDKVVSHYAYRVQTNQTGLGSKAVPFHTWVREAYGRRNPIFHDKPLMFMPQSRWLCDGAGNVLVNFVGRFENLQADFDTVCSRLGRPPKPLPHVKASTRAAYRQYYDDEARQVVADWFAEDIARFGYMF